ncbi:MAG: tetratricopeptide repeat protein [Candidatus Omnitrophota bacterium]
MRAIQIIKNLSAAVLLFVFVSWAEANLPQQEARVYREKGYRAQRQRDYDRAFMFYKKALALNPSDVAVYNDLGVIYEYRGDEQSALQAYRRALQMDPDYPRTYYNLAALYEEEGDFLKASFYWRKRISLGDPHSAATLRAEQHLRRISQVYPHIAREIKQEQARKLAAEIGVLKQQEKKSARGKKAKVDKYRQTQIKQTLLRMNAKDRQPTGPAAGYIAKGRQAYANEDYPAAIKHFSDATYLDPRNQKVQKLLEESQKKMLLR